MNVVRDSNYVYVTTPVCLCTLVAFEVETEKAAFEVETDQNVCQPKDMDTHDANLLLVWDASYRVLTACPNLTRYSGVS